MLTARASRVPGELAVAAVGVLRRAVIHYNAARTESIMHPFH